MRDVDKFGRLAVYKFTSLQAYMLCVMMISLEIWRFGRLRIACDDDTFGSLEVRKFTYGV